MTMLISRLDEAGRRRALVEILARRRVLTVVEAWEYGYELGFYESGDAYLAKADLNAVGRRHDGFWRYRSGDPRRERAIRWSDYWTPRVSDKERSR